MSLFVSQKATNKGFFQFIVLHCQPQGQGLFLNQILFVELLHFTQVF